MLKNIKRKRIFMWYLYAGISAIFSAGAAVVEKKALVIDKPLNFSFILALFNIVLSLPFLTYVDFDKIEMLTILVLYGKSILGSFAFLFVMTGLKKLDISNSLPLLVMTPAVVAFFAFLFLGESLNHFEIGGMLFLMVGTYVLQLKKGADLLEPFKITKQNKAYLFIIGAILIFTITSILDKTLLGRYRLQPQAFLPIQHIFLGFNFFIMWLFSKDNRMEFKETYSKSWKMILVVSVFTIIYRYSQILAVQAGSVALVLSVKRTSVFFATVIGGHYFKESNILRKSLATVVMIGGCVLVILY
jgi:drug/metabolite transporter (DMT)-like permease